VMLCVGSILFGTTQIVPQLLEDAFGRRRLRDERRFPERSLLRGLPVSEEEWLIDLDFRAPT